MSDKTTEDDLMLVHGDCVEVMRSLDENTFDAILLLRKHVKTMVFSEGLIHVGEI